MATTPFPVGDHTCAPPKSMAALSRSSKFMLKTPWFSSSLQLRPFSASSPILSHQNQIPIKPISPPRTAVRVRNKVKADLKDNWLASLSSPLPPHFANLHAQDQEEEEGPDPNNAGSDWVIGIDPDISGAMAVLKGDDSECPAQVFDSPHLPLLVGGKVRRRLDAKSIIQLLRSFDAPIGTTAYIEQSIPFPKDGKQGWWSGGFGYGLWIGILVTLGFSVVPVPSFSWKKKFELSGSTFTKDDSRRVASTLFPSLSLQLKRKKDHGRAEALLIAAYGRGLKMELDSSFTLEELVS